MKLNFERPSADYYCVTVARSEMERREQVSRGFILECVWVATDFGHRNLVNTNNRYWHVNEFYSFYSNFGPFVLPIPEQRFVDVTPLPLLLLLAVVAFSQHDVASVVAGLKALRLVGLVSQLLRVQVIPDVLIAVQVMAGVQLNRIADWLDAVRSVGVINYLLVLPKRVVLMATWVQFVRTAVVENHVVIELATGIDAFVGESNVFDLKLI